MAERTCCKTCQKLSRCSLICSCVGLDPCLEEDCYFCSDYEDIPVPASSKPRIVAV